VFPKNPDSDFGCEGLLLLSTCIGQQYCQLGNHYVKQEDKKDQFNILQEDTTIYLILASVW
jgi:hypothetical protein